MLQMISEIKTVSGWPGLRYCSRVDRERALEKYLGQWEYSTMLQGCGSPACIHFFSKLIWFIFKLWTYILYKLCLKNGNMQTLFIYHCFDYMSTVYCITICLLHSNSLRRLDDDDIGLLNYPCLELLGSTCTCH